MQQNAAGTMVTVGDEQFRLYGCAISGHEG